MPLTLDTSALYCAVIQMVRFLHIPLSTGERRGRPPLPSGVADTFQEAVVVCLSRGQTHMLELVPPGLQIDFVGKAKIWVSISVVVILIGMASIVWRGGVNQGIDFSGGALLQLRFSQPADLGMVRDALRTLGLERSIVQHYGGTQEVLI